jgi:NAD(P)H dehydrogenase (quinone)
MRILYVYCHPLPESFHAAIRVTALAALASAGGVSVLNPWHGA